MTFSVVLMQTERTTLARENRLQAGCRMQTAAFVVVSAVGADLSQELELPNYCQKDVSIVVRQGSSYYND